MLSLAGSQEGFSSIYLGLIRKIRHFFSKKALPGKGRTGAVAKLCSQTPETPISPTCKRPTTRIPILPQCIGCLGFYPIHFTGGETRERPVVHISNRFVVSVYVPLSTKHIFRQRRKTKELGDLSYHLDWILS